MSHHPIIFSPESTSLADRTVGELVAERPGRSRIFQSFQIDFCCQGGRTMREACQAKGISLESVTEQIEAEQANPVPDVANPAELPPAELVSYIVEKHHGFLRSELPRLHTMSRRVAQVHGSHTPSLVEVYEVFTGLFQEMDSHMRKEEEILFPMIQALSRGESVPMLLDGPISRMEEEHAEAGEALARLRELTSGFQPPGGACNTYRALFAGLADLESDLHQHIHLENHVLFPQAEEIAKSRTA